MIALAPEDRADLLRWLVSGAIILLAHGAIAASVIVAAFEPLAVPLVPAVPRSL